MNKSFYLLLLFIFLSIHLNGQKGCEHEGRYTDIIFEVTDLETTDIVFANFTSDQIWNQGDTSANNICFDPRNYMTPKDDGTWDMSMTIIYPKTTVDNCSERASIIFMHGGGYAHKPGNNTSTAALATCVDLALRGYVVALINYRKGWDIRDAKNFTGLGPLLPGCQNCPCEGGNSNCDPFSFMKNTYAMAQDGRAAHRKLINEKNSFGIDESLVFYMGASTGAIGALHASFAADDMGSYQNDDNTTLESHLGAIDDIGEPLNNPDEFNIAGVSVIAGAIKDKNWIESSDNIPVMFNHGLLDEAVRYCYGTILDMKYFIGINNNIKHLALEGPGRLYKDIQCLTEEEPESKTKVWLHTHKGLYHNFCAPLGSTDLSDNCDELSSLTLALDLNAAFMNEIIVGNPLQNHHKLTESAHVSGPCNIQDSNSETPCSNYQPCVINNTSESFTTNISIYPNPSYSGQEINILSDQTIEKVEFISLQGNIVKINTGNSIFIPQSTIPGIYYLQIHSNNNVELKRIVIF